MKELAVRLKRGDDLRTSIEEICRNIDMAVVLSGVGCIKGMRIRMAKAQSYLQDEEDHEIVSLNGTVIQGKCHLHISLSDETGRCIGGHLEKGCIVNTTCELVLGILEEYTAERIFDEETGYPEAVFHRKKEVDHD